MSGLEILAVVGCVAAVASAYHDGSELIHEIKERRRAKKALQTSPTQDRSTQELEASLSRGEVTIRSQYDHNYRRLGGAFAQGDRMYYP